MKKEMIKQAKATGMTPLAQKAMSAGMMKKGCAKKPKKG